MMMMMMMNWRSKRKSSAAMPWWGTLTPHKPKAFKNLNLARPNNGNLSNSLDYYNYSGEESSITRELLLSDGPGNNAVVPKGYLAVYVGPEERRFVIPACYLSMPDFRGLMERAAEEFGYQHEGGLRIPCEEDQFEQLLDRCLAMHQDMSSKGRHKKQ